MKKFFFLCSLISCTTIAIAAEFKGPINLENKFFKNEEVKIEGPATLSNIEAHSLKIEGNLNFNHLKVNEKAKIEGTTEGENGLFGKLETEGQTTLKEIEAKDLDSEGPLNFNHIIVTDEAEFNGATQGSYAKVGKLKAEGVFNVDHLIVTEKAKIEGSAAITGATFQGDLVLIGNEFHFANITTNNIKIKEDDNSQTLYISGTSVINGDIEFKSGQGKIVTHGKNVVFKGKIKGATIENR